jgi:hypothetical protein
MRQLVTRLNNDNLGDIFVLLLEEHLNLQLRISSNGIGSLVSQIRCNVIANRSPTVRTGKAKRVCLIRKAYRILSQFVLTLINSVIG